MAITKGLHQPQNKAICPSMDSNASQPEGWFLPALGKGSLGHGWLLFPVHLLAELHETTVSITLLCWVEEHAHDAWQAQTKR